MDNNQELQDSQTPEEAGDLHQTPDNLPEPTEEALDYQTVSQRDYNRLYARAKKAEELNKQFKEKFDKNEPQDDTSASSKSNFQELSARDVVKLQSEGYSNKEILMIEEYSQKTGQSVSSLLSDELVKTGLEALRQKEKVSQATPSPSSRSAQTISKDEYNKMSSEEKSKKFGYAAWKAKR